MVPFRFLLSEDQTPVAPGSPHWALPLPVARKAAADTAAAHRLPDGAAPTYGAYFRSLEEALGEDRCRPLRDALLRLTGAPPGPADIEAVVIQLLKHGHFYHPSKVTVRAAGTPHRLALNVALSADGIDLLPRETAALRRLAEQGDGLGVPRVLAQGVCAPARSADRPPGMWFLSPWYDDFHEFHLTRQPDGRLAVGVWDGAPDPPLLSADQTARLLEGAARRLTAAVNPHTLAHIFPWHHAAGDFVVRLDRSGHPALRLVTVREYQPLLPPPEAEVDAEASLERLLYALALLVVQAALRLRVDRLDGVGEVALHPVAVVAPICRGLLDGLVRMRRRWQLPAELDGVLADYLGTLSPAQIQDLNHELQGGFAPGSPERAACAPHLEAHAEALHTCLQSP
jgi:hypothetical protein